MTPELRKALEGALERETLLGQIIVWLRAKNLWEQAGKDIPMLDRIIKNTRGEADVDWPPKPCPVCKKPYKYFGKSKMMCEDPSTQVTGVKVEYCACKKKP